MTLTNRITLFFLAALAVVLLAFSAGRFLLVRDRLHAELDGGAKTELDTLEATVEFTHGLLEWEPEERRTDALAKTGPVWWAVYDEGDRWLDGTPGLRPMMPAVTFSKPAPQASRGHVTWDGEAWLVVRRTLLPAADAPRAAVGPEEDRAALHSALTLVAAVPLGNYHATLRRVVLELIGMSALFWTVTAVLGRWVCRRALAPVTRMADAVGRISSDTLGARLQNPGTGDELARLSAAFNDLLGRLEDACERQKRFTAKASHQLRTPLAGMLGQLDVALRRDRPPEEYRRALGEVRRQAEQMRELVEMLLFLAREDADARLPDTEAVDLRDWLLAFTAAAAPPGREADVGPGDVAAGVRAYVHGPLLAQAVGNLVENACKYSDRGTPVRLHLARVAGDAVITVEDRGHGVAAADLPHLFEPFYRSADAQQRGVKGTGLGLAVTARIMTAHGGRAGAESGPGAGSRFWVAVPLAAEDS